MSSEEKVKAAQRAYTDNLDKVYADFKRLKDEAWLKYLKAIE